MAVKRTIHFKDIDGNDVEEDWYFSLDKSDVLDMDIVHHENVEEYLAEILKNKDSRRMLELWRELIFRSVAKREANLLVKDDEVLREFKFGGAYRQFFSEILEMEDAGAAFFMSIMPADIQAKVAQEQAREYSKDELLEMTDEEFAKVAGKDETSMSREHLLIAFQRRNGKKAA